MSWWAIHSIFCKKIRLWVIHQLIKTDSHQSIFSQHGSQTKFPTAAQILELSSFVTQARKWADSELSTTLQPNMQEKWRDAKSLWLSQWEFSENNSKWPMFSDTFFSHWKTDLEKKTYCNCLQGHVWNNNFLMELYNNGKVSKHLSLLCCINHTRVGVLSLSLSVCVCVSFRVFDFFEPDHHEQFLYTPLQNKLRRRHREHFPRKTAKETKKTFPESFSSWRSWQKKHFQEVFFLKILTEGTFPRVFLLEDLDRNIRKSFVLEDLNRNIP